METKTNQNQVIIHTDTENQKKLQTEMLVTLGAGALTGVAVIIALLWVVEKIAGI